VTGRSDLLEAIRAAVRRREYRLTLHGFREATADRISVSDIESAIIGGAAEIIEDYPDDPRGASCLILGVTEAGRAIHVVVSYPPHVAVITVYTPDPERWADNRMRRQS